MCKYCTGDNPKSIFKTWWVGDGNAGLWVMPDGYTNPNGWYFEGPVLFWKYEYDQGNIEAIKYCPMCGRNLKKTKKE